mmetsp:Transcript_30226/g.37336  ORF Transcript_30226/g.37336 Transcript_30226/m.37336 type:complete len:109 (-) Transcript_30226:601-927(-)
MGGGGAAIPIVIPGGGLGGIIFIGGLGGCICISGARGARGRSRGCWAEPTGAPLALLAENIVWGRKLGGLCCISAASNLSAWDPPGPVTHAVPPGSPSYTHTALQFVY